MINAVDEVFKKDIDREESVDLMTGDIYGDLIDLVNESHKGSIFDNEEEVFQYAT